MSNDVNSCHFIGRLGKDPVIRYTGDGSPIASFSIAVGWKAKDKEGTEWVNCTAFGKLAEIVQTYLAKGSKVYVGGRMKTDKYTTKDGVEKYSTNIVLSGMQMLDAKTLEVADDKLPPEPRKDAFEDVDQDIPF